MNQILYTLILLSTLTITQALPTASGTDTLTCVGGSFIAGERGEVTCIFHDDLSETFHQIYVIKQAFDSLDEDETPLVCFRLINKKLKCTVAKGYSFDGNISETLVLKIPRVTERSAGQYSCHIVPPGGEVVKECSVIVQETRSRQSSHSTTEQTGDAHDSGLSQTNTFPLLIVIVVIGIILLVAGFVTWVCLWRTRKSASDAESVAVKVWALLEEKQMMRRLKEREMLGVRYTPAPQNVGSEEYAPVRDLGGPPVYHPGLLAGSEEYEPVRDLGLGAYQNTPSEASLDLSDC